MKNPLTKQIQKWRKQALKEVTAIKNTRAQSAMAREYYEIDQSSMNADEKSIPWPEMKELIKPIQKGKAKRKRDQLIKARSSCQRVTYYKEAWHPSLEEFRSEHPFDPRDDVTKPHKNQDKKPNEQ